MDLLTRPPVEILDMIDPSPSGPEGVKYIMGCDYEKWRARAKKLKCNARDCCTRSEALYMIYLCGRKGAYPEALKWLDAAKGISVRAFKDAYQGR